MNQDSVVNILDLLRLRDIVIGRGPVPSEFEMAEGDLNMDTEVDSNDVDYLRDILLMKVGLPHLIDSSGGQVIGNGGRTTFTIPEGAYTETKRICVEDYAQSAFEEEFSTPLSMIGEGVSFLAGARLVVLNPSSDDVVLPAGVEMMEEIAPDMVIDSIGTNAVFNVGRDSDGDGIPDFSLLGDLTINDAGSTMLFTIEPQIHINSIQRVEVDFATGTETVIPADRYEPRHQKKD